MITKEKIQATLPALRAAFQVVLYLLKVTTYFVIGMVAYNFFTGKIPPFFAYSMTALVTYFGGFAIDGLLDNILPLAATRGNAVSREEKQFHLIVRVLAVVLLLITGTLSWWAMPEVAEAAIREVDNATELAVIQQVSSDTRATIEQKTAELERAEQTERNRVREAEQEGRQLVAAAIAAGPERWQELYSEKNSWFLKQGGAIGAYLRSIRDAEKKAAEMVQAEKDLAGRIRSEKSRLESRRTAQADQAVTSLASTIQAREERRGQRLDNLSNVLLIMDVSWMLIAAVLAYLIGLVDGHRVEERKNAIGLIFEVATHAEQSALKTVEWNLIGRKREEKKDETRRNAPTERAPSPDATPTVIPVRNGTDATPDPTQFAKLVLSEIQANMNVPTQKTEPTQTTEHRPRTQVPSESVPSDSDAKPTTVILYDATRPTEKVRRKTEKAEAEATQKRRCLNCDADISHRTVRAKYCSDACRKDYHERK